MAQMHPRPLPMGVQTDPRRGAERKVYEALDRTLDDRFSVFYGVAWLGRPRHGSPRDGETDFVLAHPEHGVLAMEVKGGRVGRDGQTGEWISVDRNGIPHAIDDPFAQVRAAKFALLEKIKEQPAWGQRWVEIAHAVAFPDCAAPTVPLTPDAPPEIVVSAADLDRLGQRVLDIYGFWRGRQEPRASLGADGVNMLTRLLARSFSLPSPLGYELVETDRQILRLTEEQFSLLDFLSRQRRVVISGGAGTGKSMLALEKAKRLAREGFTVLLSCFNRPLADYLRRSAGDIERLHVLNFHRLCYDVAREARIPLADPTDRELEAEYFEKTMPDALLAALDRVSRRYDAIIVDEAQDFFEAWWDPLQLCLSDTGEGVLYAFYDDNQRLYRRVSTFPRGLAEFPLTQNLRNTVRIHEVASRFYRGEKLACPGPEGRPVEIIPVVSVAAIDREVGHILHRLIREERIAPEAIAVLTGSSLDRSRLGRQRKIGAFSVTDDQDAEPGKVLLQTIHRFKGLERPVVVLTALEGLQGDEAVAVLYVGSSRARVYLIIVATTDTLTRLDLAAPSQKGH